MNETLMKVQRELKAPKDKYNPFGKYNYRSCEGILEGVKPLLDKHHALLTLTDSIVVMEGRWYVKATAIFESEEGSVIVNGWARESEAKKGMDDSQITGTASSYARKYALNGLFLIDDNKDSDTVEFKEETERRAEAEKPKVNAESIENLKRFASQVGVGIDAICARYGIKTLQDMTTDNYVDAVKSLEKNAERLEKERKANERNNKKG